MRAYLLQRCCLESIECSPKASSASRRLWQSMLTATCRSTASPAATWSPPSVSLIGPFAACTPAQRPRPRRPHPSLQAPAGSPSRQKLLKSRGKSTPRCPLRHPRRTRSPPIQTQSVMHSCTQAHHPKVYISRCPTGILRCGRLIATSSTTFSAAATAALSLHCTPALAAWCAIGHYNEMSMIYPS